ncbi:protein-arginine deiminase type-4-like [Monodelphis domestica]|uniref:protein-arginine deiminase type-4-like n=1 Tax=Monodelphis domestica TaxID=13616 RepID=UPI0024E2410F|nr:protein-arginine deiminase type-4-like [Monodelphis domestica]
MASGNGDLISLHGKLVNWKEILKNGQKPEHESVTTPRSSTIPTSSTSPKKVFPVSVGQPLKIVCPIGSLVFLDLWRLAPKGYRAFEAQNSDGLTINVSSTKLDSKSRSIPSRWYLKSSSHMALSAVAPSTNMFSDWVKITYFKRKEQYSNCVTLVKITCVSVSLIADTYLYKRQYSKDSEKHKQGEPSWQGPVMLVNCSCRNEYPPVEEDCDECQGDVHHMPKMTLKTQCPFGFFDNHEIIISCSHPSRVKLYGIERPSMRGTRFSIIMGPNRPHYRFKYLRNQECRALYVEALSFPDADFPGLVTFTVSLLSNAENNSDPLICKQRVVYRVAPWFMIPNTQRPVEIYIPCNMKSQPLPPWKFYRENERSKQVRWLINPMQPKPRIRWNLISNFMNTILDFSKKAKCKPIFFPRDKHRLATWIGNEVVFGYTQSPFRGFPVFLDFPWKKRLTNFVLKNSLPSFTGYIIHERGDDNELDATGFLVVSPPVTAHGIFYPLGRILIGTGSLPRENVPRVNQRLLRFIQAQKVQHPLELFSEWLLEGNVKDFLTFVPAKDRKGFRLLLASPSACYELFRREQSLGHGNTSLLEGVDPTVLSYSERHKMTIDEILANKSLWKQNDYVETCISWNRRVLKKELGLSERDIIDIPQLFHLGWIQDPSSRQEVLRAGHFFPNMLNMIVLGTYLGIPKPFGPIINGVCCVEKRVQNLLEPLGLRCHFLGEFFGHQEEWRDAYYWFNILREPLPFKWWNCVV